MGLVFSESYANMAENCAAATTHLLQHLQNERKVGKFHIGNTASSLLDGTGSVIYPPLQKSHSISRSYATFSIRPQIFALESNSVNFSLEVFRCKNRASGAGWLLSNDRTDDIIEIAYVRVVSDRLQEIADRHLAGKVFFSDWDKKRETALTLAAYMREKDIVEMDVIFMDRKAILNWLSDNGYPSDVLINEAKKIWRSGKKGKYDLGKIHRSNLQLNYSGRMPANQAETVVLSTNVGFSIASQWVAGRYLICQDNFEMIKVEERFPFHFDWLNHGHNLAAFSPNIPCSYLIRGRRST